VEYPEDSTGERGRRTDPSGIKMQPGEVESLLHRPRDSTGRGSEGGGGAADGLDLRDACKFSY
jgi:hypothetical protein